jgi:hypothetical protein
VVGSLEASPRLNCEHASREKAYIFVSTTVHRIMLETHQCIKNGYDARCAPYFDCFHAGGTSESRPAAPWSTASEMPCHSREGIDEETASHQLSCHARCIFSLSMTKTQSLAALIGAVRVTEIRIFLANGKSRDVAGAAVLSP